MNVYEVWVKKYGKEEADKKWKIRNQKLSESHKIKNSKLNSKQRSEKFGSKGELNPMFGKTVHDVWVDKYGEEEADLLLIKSRTKQSKNSKGINAGDKNPMKRPDVVARMKKTRIKILKNPELRQEISNSVKKAWKDGKYDNVAVGRCKWYDYTCSNGNIIKVQGTWELAYVKWLDENNIKFISHRGIIPYTLNGKSKNYYPDFYLIDDDEYIDIKNDYHYSLQKEKFDAIRNSNPKLKIRIILKEELINLGCL